MKRIAVITASRADYGIYLPVLKAIGDCPELQYNLVASGNPDYLAFPLHEGFNVNDKPDVVMVLGDTMPMLEATIQAAEDNILIAHIQGGDTTGSIDNKIRYAISAFADWHFPTLPQHALRLRLMGIPPSRIKVVGPLGIYAMKDAEFISEDKLRAKLGLSDKPIVIVIQHPVSTEAEQAGWQMQQTLEAVMKIPDIQPVVIYPNSEAGSEDMIKVIRESGIKSFVNLPYLTFISLLKYSSVIIGNSSCGLVEAPLFNVPCVNVGTRQGQRSCGSLTLNVDYAESKIREAIIYFLSKSKWASINPYALDIDGPKIIVDTLKGI
jgi:UDP-N-acetylglucosamine 2-epimerase (non-hydrolysing)/GDP/UDP-N,N'-diacetylbacillosamine 2-epimerase (hydrolysing)